MYKHKENMFTVSQLLRMGELREKYKALDNQGDFCLLLPSAEEGKPSSCFQLSPLPFFVNATTLPVVEGTVMGLLSNPSASFFFSKSGSLTNPKSSLTREVYKYGAPIEWEGHTYKDKLEDFYEQEDIFSRELGIHIYEWAEETMGDDVEVYAAGTAMFEYKISEYYYGQLTLAFICICLIFLYQCLHFESLFLAVAALVQAIAVFTPALMIYKGIYSFRTLGWCDLIIAFIFPGIIADNLLYIKDTWTHSKGYVWGEDIERRMAFTWRRCIGPVSVTHLTMIIVFASTIGTPLVLVAKAAAIGTMALIFNYFYTIMYFPAILSIHEKYIKYNCCTLYHIYVYCCCRGKAKRMEEEANSDLKQMNDSTLDPPITKSKYIYKSKTIVARASSFGVLDRFFGVLYPVVFKYTKFWWVGLGVIWFGCNLVLSGEVEGMEGDVV